MRVWLDESGVRLYVQHAGGGAFDVLTADAIDVADDLPLSAVPLVTPAVVVNKIRPELLGLRGLTTAQHRAIRQILDRAAGES